MPHSAPNIPTSQPGNIKVETINSTINAIKANANTKVGNGIEGSSGSSGNSQQVPNVAEKQSFWAMLIRRLRYFSRPSLSYLRISLAEKKRKFSVPTTDYDIKGWYTTSGEWISDIDPKRNDALIFYRNPWDSYDGYIREDGSWDEKEFPPFYPYTSGVKNEFYFKPKEERYAKYGPQKATIGLLSVSSQVGGPSNVPEAEYYIGYCPQYFWCYSWCELVEDLNFKRADCPLFALSMYKTPRSFDIQTISRHPAPVIPDPAPYDPDNQGTTRRDFKYYCYELSIAAEYMSHGGLYGTAMGPNRAHEVNSSKVNVGTVVRMYKSKDNFYLFNSPQTPVGRGIGTSTGIENAPYHFWAKAYTINHIW